MGGAVIKYISVSSGGGSGCPGCPQPQAFPNPAGQTFEVGYIDSFTGAKLTTDFDIDIIYTLMSFNGQAIGQLHTCWANQEITFPTGTQPGIYFLRIDFDQSGTSVLRIVKDK